MLLPVLAPWTGVGGMEEKARVERQNSKKGFEKNEHSCSVEGVFIVSDWTVRLYSKVVFPTWKIQSSSKLRQAPQ